MEFNVWYDMYDIYILLHLVDLVLTQPSWTLKKKRVNFIFPTKYGIPKSLKFSQWPSKFIGKYTIISWDFAWNFRIVSHDFMTFSPWEGALNSDPTIVKSNSSFVKNLRYSLRLFDFSLQRKWFIVGLKKSWGVIAIAISDHMSPKYIRYLK